MEVAFFEDGDEDEGADGYEDVDVDFFAAENGGGKIIEGKDYCDVGEDGAEEEFAEGDFEDAGSIADGFNDVATKDAGKEYDF